MKTIHASLPTIYLLYEKIKFIPKKHRTKSQNFIIKTVRKIIDSRFKVAPTLSFISFSNDFDVNKYITNTKK